MWLHGDQRVGPKPIGAAHRAGCNLPPCAPIVKKRKWALEAVVRHAPGDTVRTGGEAWAAHAIRQIGDGRPRTLEEVALLAKYPDAGTPRVSSAASSTAESEAVRAYAREPRGGETSADDICMLLDTYSVACRRQYARDSVCNM